MKEVFIIIKRTKKQTSLTQLKDIKLIEKYKMICFFKKR